ncbi:hypothetical protein K353_03345 [Kitasatospora sp. SolWspMP-SS2h]|uniref:hypothetical protein n=1 Tax=Kitasatospora sp. SolWspMP-SS2h TaxID=1305729 RepID=UPI000DBF6FDB|nr:hypothetical protein [Kitasatospora sp. SolWspMP-SS2h]RAJ40453.1 hypothetical protein K353_03345 [Kitasatospora sp. SolWspMP-SS2h]
MTTAQPRSDDPVADGSARESPCPISKLTIRVYRVRGDGTRVQVSHRTCDEAFCLPLVSALIWPPCGCPRCAVAPAVGGAPDAA